MKSQYDAIVIGAGHNGLVTAAILAKAGNKVLVLEQRDTIGGAAATEEIFPGFKFNTGAHDAGLFRPEIVRSLSLESFGLEFIQSPVSVFAPQTDGSNLMIWRDVDKTVAEISKFSKSDAQKYPEYLEFIKMVTGVIDKIATLTPPELFPLKAGELMAWAKVALGAKRLGDKGMIDLIRVLPMTTQELMNEWFESDAVRGALGAPGVTGSRQGPQASGTAFMLMYQQLGSLNGGFKSSQFVRGGIGQLSQALAKAAEKRGAEIRTGSSVKRVVLEDGKAVGVELGSGDTIKAKVIVSNADPRRTMFDLIGPDKLEMRVMRRVRNIKFRGTTAKLNLTLNGLPEFKGAPGGTAHLGGHIVISPSLDYLEHAYDDAKYGRVSENPYLDITIPSVLDDSLAPSGKHVMSISMQYAPYELRDSNWDKEKDKLAKGIINTLSAYAPNLKTIIKHQQIITPKDWEEDYGLTEGSIFHGQMGLDQILIMRPIGGYAQYKTQIDNLFLCGAGTHPGGGVSGAPGSNAAREILKAL